MDVWEIARKALEALADALEVMEIYGIYDESEYARLNQEHHMLSGELCGHYDDGR